MCKTAPRLGVAMQAIAAHIESLKDCGRQTATSLLSLLACIPTLYAVVASGSESLPKQEP